MVSSDFTFQNVVALREVVLGHVHASLGARVFRVCGDKEPGFAQFAVVHLVVLAESQLLGQED